MQVDPPAPVDLPPPGKSVPVRESESSTVPVADASSELSAAEEPVQSPKRSRKGKGKASKLVTTAKQPAERKQKGKARKSIGNSDAIQLLMDQASMTLEDARAALQDDLPAAPKRRNAGRVETYVEPDSDEDTELEAQLLGDEEAERQQRSRKPSRKGVASAQYAKSQASGSTSVKGNAGKKRSKAPEPSSEADDLDEAEMGTEDRYDDEEAEEDVSDYHEADVKSKAPQRGRKAKTSVLPKSVSDSVLTQKASKGSAKKKSASSRSLAKQTEAVNSDTASDSQARASHERKGRTKVVTSKKASSAPKERSESVSSSTSLSALPPFPPSSQPGPVVWDFGMLDTILFVTVCARSKATVTELPLSGKAVETSPPRFWWPARISSRNRLNFRVKLFVDKQKQILQFS